MQLLSLTIDGFKSFAQKTTIKFKPGMTGIVGPNGSGKSNIIEAIRWVMGEQSAHQLRGDKMADVIFSGSNSRAPLNRALVSITFDNSDHYLASDYTELTITRKLYRNGDSEYLVNDQPVRLKDIVDLFIDSGLGRESFSIISQGRIEAIFNGKPLDRRAIIETVAGVAKYKKNKDAAEKKLTTTMDNLHRVSDIVSELKSQMEPLADESALAEDYLEQKGQFDLLDRTQTVRSYDHTHDQLAKLTKQLADKKQLEAKYNQDVRAASQELLKLKQRQQLLQGTKDQLQSNILEHTETIAKLKNQQSVASVRKEQQEAEQQRLTDQLTAVQKQRQQLQQQLADAKQAVARQQTAIADHQKELAAAQQMTGEERIAQLNDQLKQKRAHQVELMQTITNLQNQQNFLKTNHEQALHSQQQSADERTQLTNRLQTAQDDEQAARKQADKAAQATKQLTTQLAESNQRRSQLQQEYSDAQRKWYQALGDVHSTQSRIKNYQSMQYAYAGYYQGVQFVLKNRSRFPGLAGAVNELLTVPKRYTTAIETVLGSQLQQLVVDTQATGKDIIHALVRQRAGRVTILPLDSLSQRRPSNVFQELTSMPGYLGRAADLVKFAPRYQIIVEHLLGNTAVADNLDHATAIARAGHHYVRVITLDGQLINASGSMTGGANRHQRMGLLSQKQLAEQLEETLKNQQTTASQFEQEVAKLQQAQSANDQVNQQLQEQLTSQQADLHSMQSKLQIAASQVQTLERQLKAVQEQAAQQQSQHQDYEQQAQSLVKQVDNAQAEFDQSKDQIAHMEQQIQELQTNASAQNEQLHQMQEWLAVAKERLQQLQQQSQALRHQDGELAVNADHLQEQLDQLKNDLSHHQADNQSAATVLATTEEQLQSAKSALQENGEELTKLADKLTTAEQQHDRLVGLQRTTLNDVNDVNAQKVKAEAKMDNQLNHLSEQYAMTIDEARQKVSDLPDDQLKIKLKLLKRGLADLGEVNTGAIEEYKRVKERYDFLTDQQNDLLASREQLRTTMNEMDDQVKDRFSTTFKKVSTAFNETFQQIFAGGQAKLVLTDPDNLLTSGVDIMAQPPGKKNQRMSLLSGGEKALTAITLLFAILKVRPVPFAILDEPEAALDEVNVQRFANYLSHFGTDGPQFIVITHRKGTMMNANVLYGVTMQESGVSRMVSVDVVYALENEHED